MLTFLLKGKCDTLQGKMKPEFTDWGKRQLVIKPVQFFAHCVLQNYQKIVFVGRLDLVRKLFFIMNISTCYEQWYNKQTYLKKSLYFIVSFDMLTFLLKGKCIRFRKKWNLNSPIYYIDTVVLYNARPPGKQENLYI